MSDDLGTDDDPGQYAVVETRDGDGEREGVPEQRDFMLDNVLYSAFNT